MTEKQRKELDELKADVLKVLDDKVNDIFIDFQNSMEIKDGGIEPYDFNFLQYNEEKLANNIAWLLMKQKGEEK